MVQWTRNINSLPLFTTSFQLFSSLISLNPFSLNKIPTCYTSRVIRTQTTSSPSFQGVSLRSFHPPPPYPNPTLPSTSPGLLSLAAQSYDHMLDYYRGQSTYNILPFIPRSFSSLIPHPTSSSSFHGVSLHSFLTPPKPPTQPPRPAVPSCSILLPYAGLVEGARYIQHPPPPPRRFLLSLSPKLFLWVPVFDVPVLVWEVRVIAML